MQNLPGIFDKLGSLNANLRDKLVSQNQATALFDISSRIREEASALRTEAVPAGNASAATNLQTRKRRALADLLKHLKRLGLSRNPSARLLESQKHLLLFHELGCSGHQQSDHPFYDLIDKFPAVRMSSGAVHPDLQPGQIANLVGNLESALGLIKVLRTDLINLVESCGALQEVVSWMQQACDVGLGRGSVPPNAGFNGRFPLLETDFALTGASALVEGVACLQELLQTIETHSALVPNGPSATWIEDRVQAGKSLIDQMVPMQAYSQWPTLKIHQQALHDAHRFLVEAASAAASHKALTPDWTYLWHPVAVRLEHLAAKIDQSAPAHLTTLNTIPEPEASGSIVEAVLIAFQRLSAAFSPAEVSTDSFQPPIVSIPEGARLQHRLTTALAVTSVLSCCRDFCARLQKSPSSEAEQEVGRGLPFVRQYLAFALSLYHTARSYHDAMIDLTLTVATLTVELAEKGICRPQESDDAAPDPAASGEAQLSDGTGLGGDGGGEKNISNEIDSQEQVEGLQDQADGDEHPEEKMGDSGDAIEGSDLDMTGARDQEVEMQDDAADEEEQSAAEEAETEDQVDHVDPLAESAIDEQFWADQKPQTDASQGEDVASEPQEGQQQNSEMVANEQEGQEEPREAQSNPAEQPAPTESSASPPPAPETQTMDHIDISEKEPLDRGDSRQDFPTEPDGAADDAMPESMDVDDPASKSSWYT